MTFTINLAPDVEARLRAAAEQRGQPVDTYIREIIEREALRAPLTAEEKKQWANEMRGSLSDATRSTEDFLREKHGENVHEENPQRLYGEARRRWAESLFGAGADATLTNDDFLREEHEENDREEAEIEEWLRNRNQ